jgi:hypothetical protein
MIIIKKDNERNEAAKQKNFIVCVGFFSWPVSGDLRLCFR